MASAPLSQAWLEGHLLQEACSDPSVPLSGQESAPGSHGLLGFPRSWWFLHGVGDAVFEEPACPPICSGPWVMGGWAPCAAVLDTRQVSENMRREPLKEPWPFLHPSPGPRLPGLSTSGLGRPPCGLWVGMKPLG